MYIDIISFVMIYNLNCIFFFFSLVDRKMRQMKLLTEVGGNVMGIYGKANKKDGKTTNEIEVFNLENIIAVTNNFSPD